MSYYDELSKINVNDKTEKKNGLTYLSWWFAWNELKKRYPLSTDRVYENGAGWCYHTDGKTCWVKTGVTLVDGEIAIENIEYLPIMDLRNRSIPADQVTSMDINKAIQRSKTKCIARFGLGGYIYGGEDLPENDETPLPVNKAPAAVSMSVTPEELSRRKSEVVSLVKGMSRSEEEYKKAVQTLKAPALSEMTEGEYRSFLNGLSNVLLVM